MVINGEQSALTEVQVMYLGFENYLQCKVCVITCLITRNVTRNYRRVLVILTTLFGNTFL